MSVAPRILHRPPRRRGAGPTSVAPRYARVAYALLTRRPSSSSAARSWSHEPAAGAETAAATATSVGLLELMTRIR